MKLNFMMIVQDVIVFIIHLALVAVEVKNDILWLVQQNQILVEGVQDIVAQIEIILDMVTMMVRETVLA